MQIEDAFNVVLTLAEQNVISQFETEPELEEERLRQLSALKLVKEYLTETFNEEF